MADPKALKRYADGVRLAPDAIDAVPIGWASGDYAVGISEHPDIPGLPILKFVIGGAGAMVPTFIASSETFTVPENKQALFAMSIDNEGTLEINGFLIQVD